MRCLSFQPSSSARCLLAQRGQGSCHDVWRVQTSPLVLLLRRSVIDETVGQHQWPYLQAMVEHARRREMLQNGAGEAPARALFPRDQPLVLAREPVDEVDVEGFGETRIGHGR